MKSTIPKNIPGFFKTQKIAASFMDPKKSLMAKNSDMKKNPSDPPLSKICEWGPWKVALRLPPNQDEGRNHVLVYLFPGSNSISKFALCDWFGYNYVHLSIALRGQAKNSTDWRDICVRSDKRSQTPLKELRVLQKGRRPAIFSVY